MISSKRVGLANLFLGAVVLLGASSAVHAQSITFANFSDSGVNDFTFTNTGTSTSAFTSNEIPVNFFFDVPNSYGGVDQPISGDLVISGSVANPATYNGPIDYQTFSSINLDFTDSSGDNLLTVNDLPIGSSDPTLSGNDGSGTATLSASSSGRGSQAVTYSSSYLNFTNVSNENFGLSFSSITDTSGPESGTSGITFDQNDYIDSFTASGTGTFASTPAPTVPTSTPEPSSAAVFGVAVLSLLGLGLYRKTRTFMA